MKPFYGIDRTTDKKNIQPEGECFIAAAASLDAQRSMERAVSSAEEQLRRSQLPSPIRWLKTGCGWVAALGFLGTIRALGDVTIFEAYENAPALFWIEGICGVLWLVLTILGRRKMAKNTAQEEFIQSMHRLEGEAERRRLELGVPETAKDVDVIQFGFRWKDGKLQGRNRGSETTPYTNVSMRVYRREDVLCLADMEHRYEISISELRCLRRVKKPLIIQGWNKPEPINAPFYKPYKLTIDNYERIHVKSYGLLELTHQGVDWAIWLPPYELNYIAALTGLPITEE